MKDNFYDEIKERAKECILDDKTIDYRIKGFMTSIRMFLDGNGIEETRVDQDFLRRIMPFVKNVNDVHLFIKKDIDCDVLMLIVKSKGMNIVNLSGNYLNDHFEFINYFREKRNNNIVTEVPFELRMSKIDNDYEYHMDIIGNNSKTKYNLYCDTDNKNDLKVDMHFATHTLNIYEVFYLVSQFINDPVRLFKKCNSVLGLKRIYFNKGEMDFIKNDSGYEYEKRKIFRKDNKNE